MGRRLDFPEGDSGGRGRPLYGLLRLKRRGKISISTPGQCRDEAKVLFFPKVSAAIPEWKFRTWGFREPKRTGKRNLINPPKFEERSGPGVFVENFGKVFRRLRG